MKGIQTRQLIFIGLTVVGYWACGDDRAQPPARPVRTAQATYIGDCPGDSVFVVRDTSFVTDTIINIPLAENIDNLPEFHDCQRLIERGTYGSIVGMWASERLDSLPLDLDRANPPGGVTTTAVAAAQILNLGPADYRPLGLHTGFSCLYLSGSHNAWTATMVSGVSDKACLNNLDLTRGTGIKLDVHPQSLSLGLTEADLPPVARWDWDSVNGRNYIGVKCGDQWCEVGLGVVASASYSRHPGHGPHAELVNAVIGQFSGSAGITPISMNEMDRVLTVKGWYDEQYLASRVNTVLGPTSYIGTAFPHPSLDRIDSVDLFRGDWVPTAYVIVERAYPGKLHLEQGLNEIFMCQGDVNSCRDGNANLPTTCDLEPDVVSTPRTWFFKIVRPNGPPEYGCVDRRTHGGRIIPVGTVRWHWSDTDETLWVRCAAGCCTTH